MSMSREELLEHHIYVPDVVDDKIKAHLLLGDSVLVWASNMHCIDKSLRLLTLSNTPYFKSNFMRLSLCVNEDFEYLHEYKNSIISTKHVMWNLFLNREDVENIKNMFYD